MRKARWRLAHPRKARATYTMAHAMAHAMACAMSWRVLRSVLTGQR